MFLQPAIRQGKGLSRGVGLLTVNQHVKLTSFQAKIAATFDQLHRVYPYRQQGSYFLGGGHFSLPIGGKCWLPMNNISTDRLLQCFSAQKCQGRVHP